MLLHFEEANDGEILYNGKDVASYSRESISKNVVLFSQSTYLFQATYAENLRIAKSDASLEELQEACRKAGILDFILKSPEWFNTLVNDKQDNLSTGEKQRLGLARIFLSGAKVLLLDEATSNVDAQNEALILKQLTKAKENHAIVLISHRESTLSICDRIYEMEGGALCSIGVTTASSR